MVSDSGCVNGCTVPGGVLRGMGSPAPIFGLPMGLPIMPEDPPEGGGLLNDPPLEGGDAKPDPPPPGGGANACAIVTPPAA